jgi:hypothetical protein
VNANASHQKMYASGEFNDTKYSDHIIHSEDSVDEEAEKEEEHEDVDVDGEDSAAAAAGQGRPDRISVRCKRGGGDLRKYPIKRDLVRMRCVFIGPLGERYYDIAKPFRQYKANYLSGFDVDACRPFFVHQPLHTRSRNLRDQQFPEVGSVVQVLRAVNEEEMRQCYVEGMDVRPRKPIGLAVLRFLDSRWQTAKQSIE